MNIKIRQTGFSLIEMVVAIIVMSVMAIGLTRFIDFSTEGYVDTAERSQLTLSGRAVQERISKELRNALPNSIRITDVFDTGDAEVDTGGLFPGDQCLEFFPIIGASTYIDPAFHPGSTSTDFDAVEFNVDINVVTGDYAVIYPRKPSELYDSGLPSPGYITAFDDLDVGSTLSDTHTINLSAGHKYRRRSPLDRVYLVEEPVSFCINGTNLYRYTEYGITDDQSIPTNPAGACPLSPTPMCLPSTTPNRVLIASNLANDGFTAFDQLAATLRRNAIIQMELNFESEGENVTLNHEIILQSAP